MLAGDGRIGNQPCKKNAKPRTASKAEEIRRLVLRSTPHHRRQVARGRSQVQYILTYCTWIRRSPVPAGSCSWFIHDDAVSLSEPGQRQRQPTTDRRMFRGSPTYALLRSRVLCRAAFLRQTLTLGFTVRARWRIGRIYYLIVLLCSPLPLVGSSSLPTPGVRQPTRMPLPMLTQ